MPRIWPKRCSCGAAYDEASWSALKLISKAWPEAEWRGNELPLELRNCAHCGSTIAVEATGSSNL